MLLSKWMSLAREAKELGILIWNIEGGGEPFANKDLVIPVMKQVKALGLYGIVTTNGTLLTDDDVKMIVDMEWDRMHFSIDGYNEELNDMIRGRGCFRKTIKAVEALNKWKKERDTESPMLSINTVINNRNFRHLPQMAELSARLSADFIFTEPLIVYHKDGEHLKLSAKDISEMDPYIAEAKKICDSNGIDNNFATKDKNLDKELVGMTSRMDEVLANEASEIEIPFLSVPCFKPWDNMAIKYNGLCGHCGLIEKGGNVKEMTLSQIWYGKDMEKIRADMLKKILLDHCSRCCASDITQRRRFRKALMESVRNG
jgi:MoaA/NifB/PqqE/SkfB family radical SAM enzyme